MSSSPLVNRNATRKRPHCKECGQPLKGHPKGVCLLSNQFDHEGTPLTVPSRSSASASPGPSLGRASPVDALVRFGTPRLSSSTATPRPPQPTDGRPVMPCTFDRNDRPSEVSASPSVRGPINMSLADRIGPKVEINEDGFPVRPVDDSAPRIRQRNPTSSRHSDPIAPPRRSFYDYDEPRPIALRHSGSSIFPDHSASQQRPNVRSPTPNPWLNGMDRDEGSSQDSMGDMGSFYNGYNPGQPYDLETDDDRYLYDDDHLRHFSQRAVVGRQESSPESMGFPDDTPSEASASEAGTMHSTTQTDHTGLSINTLLQAGSAQPIMSVYSVKRELGPYLKKSARKLGLFAEVKRPPPDLRNGANADNVYLAMGRDRKQVHGFAVEQAMNANGREAHRRDGHRRTSTHACEHCHSTTPTPHHGVLYPPHTPVGPHHQSLPPGAPGSSPHMYPQPYNTAMAPPLQQPPGTNSGGAMGVVGTICTVIVGLASLGLAMVWVLARV